MDRRHGRRWVGGSSFAPRGGDRLELARAARFAIEALEERRLLTVSILHNYTGVDFNGSGGYVPPDTCGAAGPTAYVETVNQAVRLFPTKTTGASPLSASLGTFLFTTGGLPRADGGSGLSDPIVAYDEQIGRFIVGDQDVNFSTHVSRFQIAVSKTSSPASLTTNDWRFYSVVTTQSGFDADFPGNFGYNHDAFVFTLNMFGVLGGGHVQVVSMSGADLAAGAASPATFKNNLNDFSVRPTTMHGSVAGDPMWLVTEHGDNTSIDVIKMTSVLTNSAAFGYTNIPVTPYSGVVVPRNPNGTVITNNIDSRIQKAAESNNSLVAAHAVSVSSTQDVIQWYRFNVGGATPALAEQGRVSGGANTYLTYPGIDISSSGNIGMSFMRSGTDSASDFLSTWVTGRTPADAAGTMQAAVKSAAGSGVANYDDFTAGGRSGDLSGINVDPTDGSFWAANEFANTLATANWGTAIVHFNLTTPLPSTDMSVTSSGPSSITAGTNATYTITITNNGPNPAQGVVLTDTLPAGSTLVSFTKTAGPDSFTLGQNGGTATQTATANIAAGSTDTFSLTVSAPSSLANGAAFNNTASVGETNPDSNTANNSSTTSGTVVNTSPNADLAVSMSGPTSTSEGSNVTYTVTVRNNGPVGATGVSLADTLGSLLRFVSATTTQGTFGQSNGVVTFTIGSIASGSTATATVTAQAIEDGSTSNSATASSTSADPSSTNNTAAVTVSVSEPPIVVSGSFRTKSRTLSNVVAATFTHANGLEPPSAFAATINWGDGTTSAGAITQSGTTYTVRGSHTYTSTGNKWHTISVTVRELAQEVDKFGEEDEEERGHNWKMDDVVQVRGHNGQLGGGADVTSTPASTKKDETIGAILFSDGTVLA
jgi:uncharacterized repeat protein (TIGR01451 family)